MRKPFVDKGGTKGFKAVVVAVEKRSAGRARRAIAPILIKTKMHARTHAQAIYGQRWY